MEGGETKYRNTQGNGGVTEITLKYSSVKKSTNNHENGEDAEVSSWSWVLTQLQQGYGILIVFVSFWASALLTVLNEYLLNDLMNECLLR